MEKTKNVGFLLNPLLEAQRKFSVLENRLFYMGLQDVNPHLTENDKFFNEKFPDTHISPSELKKIFGYDACLTEISRTCDNLTGTTIKIWFEDGFDIYTVFQHMKYRQGKGLFIKFNEDMRPFLLDIYKSYKKYGFTKLEMEQIFYLNSSYAMRLLELLLKYRSTARNGVIEREIGIDDLREKLNVPENAYEGKMCNFRKKVLDNPLEDINTNTKYFVSYKVIKKGRKVSAFKFYCDCNSVLKDDECKSTIDSEEVPALPEPQEDGISRAELTREMLAEGMPSAAINTWLKRYGVEGAVASWRLAVEHANGRTETRHKGEQRYKYIKSCMEKNIAQSNADDAALKAEIDARKRRLSDEKKRHQKEDMEALGKLGISVERRGSDMQSVGSLLGADAPRRSIDEIVKDKPLLAPLARLKKKALHGEPQEGKTIEEQLEEQGQQRLFDDEESKDDGNIFSDGSKNSFKSKFAKIMGLECSNDEKLAKILRIDGDDESGNLLKVFALLIENSETKTKKGNREIKIQEGDE